MKKLTTAFGAPVSDNPNVEISGVSGQAKARHIENCTRCQAAYGAGVAQAIARLGTAQA